MAQKAESGFITQLGLAQHSTFLTITTNPIIASAEAALNEIFYTKKFIQGMWS